MQASNPLDDNGSHRDYSFTGVPVTTEQKIEQTQVKTKTWNKTPVNRTASIQKNIHVRIEGTGIGTIEPPHGKTNNLHRRKQRRRSASR